MVSATGTEWPLGLAAEFRDEVARVSGLPLDEPPGFTVQPVEQDTHGHPVIYRHVTPESLRPLYVLAAAASSRTFLVPYFARPHRAPRGSGYAGLGSLYDSC